MSGGFNFNFTPGAGSAPPSAPPSQKPAQQGVDVELLRSQMTAAFAQGGNVDLFEKSEYEKPGTYLEKIEEVKFVISQNKGKGTAGQAFVVCKRKIIRCVWSDPNLGKPDVPGATTATRYKLSLDPAYRSCVQFMATVCGVHHKSLTRENMIEVCMPSQMFAGVCVLTSRYFLPVDPQKPKDPFLTCYYKARVDADDLIYGMPEIPPLTKQELEIFFGGKPPVDPLWVTFGKAENWARLAGANLPTDEQKAQMTKEQQADYIGKLLGEYEKHIGPIRAQRAAALAQSQQPAAPAAPQTAG